MQYQSEEVDQLMMALMAAHKQFGVIIEKDKKGHKGAYSSLPQVLGRIHDMNKEHGLILTQASRIIDGQHAEETVLRHPASKQWISCQSFLTPSTSISPDQMWGGSKTYHRRYDALSLMGIFCSEDPTDIDGWTEERIEEVKQKEAPSVGVISEKQYGLLQVKLADVPLEVSNKIMGLAGVKSWKELPWNKFNEVLKRLESSK